MKKSKVSIDLPRFFDLLSNEDKQQYLFLQLTLSSSACKNRRNHSKQAFEKALESIKIYAVRSDKSDWKRCIVCGIFWIENDQIAVNSKQLCILLSKSISSINGSLMLLHYYKIQNSREHTQSFLKSIPLTKLKPATIELRQWTIRKRCLKPENDTSSKKDLLCIEHETEETTNNNESLVFGLKNSFYHHDEKQSSDLYESITNSESDDITSTKQHRFKSISQSILNPISQIELNNSLSFFRSESAPLFNNIYQSFSDCDIINDELTESELETNSTYDFSHIYNLIS